MNAFDITVKMPLVFTLSCFTVFVLDTGFHVYIWIGKEATAHEKGGGLAIAHVS